ncbi:FtsK/SpoIIIE family DNA translocase [Veillonella intestinalis]|uniref:FtsK/SpoIIIE family DNA translocase n=1 Tax=Veillonella intestinalis TaxID=2941341 RepID=UPI00203E60D7|nr:DNA translocase FtsK [Veillonella intestinalis]
MAEQKERAKATPRKTTKRKATSASRTTNKEAVNKGLKIRKEVRGLFIMLFAFVAFLGMFNITSGSVVDVVAGIFKYGFGFGGVIPCLYVGYVGWRILYADEGFSFTKRGILLSLVYIFGITVITLLSADPGQELLTTKIATQGGVVGGLIAVLLRTLLGNVGAIVVAVVVILGLLLLIYQISLRTGLHKAKEKTDVGLEFARNITEETVHQAKERYTEWKEQQAKRRRAYNQEKDDRFTKSAAAEVIANAAQVSADAKAEAKALLEAEPEEESQSIESSVDSQQIKEVLVPNEEKYEHIEDEDEDELEVPPFLQGRTARSFETEAPKPVMVADEAEPESERELEPETESEFKSESNPEFKTEVLGSSELDSATSEVVEKSSEVAAVTSSVKLQPVPTMEGTEADTAAVAVTVDGAPKPRRIEVPYRFPSLSMLSKGTVNLVTGQEVTHNVSVLEETLKSFGVTAHVVNATQGPTVTRYELEPAPGTKVSRILNLSDDLKMALAAIDIRIEAPIPGKSAVGIEVPNKNVTAVHLRDVLEAEKFQKARGGIPVGLGKDIAGEAIITDLAKMPHLLVAGSTGSGKSVCVNTLISSILFSRKPSEVQLILVDPKMVELSVYNGIPHLKVPVVTDMKKAAAVLRWAVREMEARYLAMSENGVRNISGFNERFPDKAMPLILIIIDELADLMMTAPDVEEAINRLAAKARAAGIHMVLATQRPSVNVITGTIKANVPSRISFAVATQIDSRTILDMAGAEKLLGKGDMLFNPIGANKPIRIQGAFISDEEVEELVAFVKQQGRPEYDESIVEEVEKDTVEECDSMEEEQDELLERAVELVISMGQASTSMLQRRFRIGYSRAARLIDTMEEKRIIGPANGSKPRDILMSWEAVQETYFSK